jgi:hypothetical protein
MKEHKIYAVLTGDIVNSTKLEQAELEEVRNRLLDAVQDVKGWQSRLVKSKAEFFRGDSWQVLLEDPGQALRVAVFLRATLRAHGGADSRLSIGIGTVKKIVSNRVSLSTGEAFEVSGGALDKMTSLTGMTIAVPSPGGVLGRWLPVVGGLCDALIGQWTERQAETVRIAVLPERPSHEEIADRLNPSVSRQAVTKALNGANWHALREAIRAFENASWSGVAKMEEEP